MLDRRPYWTLTASGFKSILKSLKMTVLKKLSIRLIKVAEK
jgi:hypothetical protein